MPKFVTVARQRILRPWKFELRDKMNFLNLNPDSAPDFMNKHPSTALPSSAR